MIDERDNEERDEAPSEGVRILGADEARAALEGAQATERTSTAGARANQPPMPRDGQPTVRISTTPGGEETSGPVPLPHWSEPPTGEVPVVNADGTVDVQTTDDEDLHAWDALAQNSPRFRSDASDWKESDFAEGDQLKDETMTMGALSNDDDPAGDDERFDKEVAAKRRRSTGTRSATPGTRPTRRPANNKPTAPRPPESADSMLRIIVGAVMVVVALIVFKAGKVPTLILASVVVGVAAFELFTVLTQRGFKPATLLGILGCVAMPIAAYHRGDAAYPIMFALMVAFTTLWYLIGVVHARAIANIGVTLFAFAWIGGLGGFAGLSLSLPNGLGILMGAVFCAVAYDIVGYFVGSQFGSSQLAPEISPGKTFEGLIGGMLASVVMAAIVVGRITPWSQNFWHSLVLGLIIAFAAPLGDLCESLVKRDLGIKDFSTLLPGHGGVLDRFDAILFALPVAYYLARAFYS